MNVSKLNIFFYTGLAISFLLAALTPLLINLPNGYAFRIAIIIILGQAHFFIAYLYYVDILRVNFSGEGKKLLLLLASFVGIVLIFYFAKYVWFVAFAPLITLLAFTVFVVHHIENMFFIGEDFNQSFLRKKRSSLSMWVITYVISFFMSFMIYAYYVLGVKTFTIWIFLISFAVLCISLFKVYKKINSYKLPLLLLPLLVFTGPFFLQKISFVEFSLVITFWHFLAWLVLYGFILVLRKKEDFPTKIKELPSSYISKIIRKTRENVWSYTMFNIFVGALMIFLYVLTSKIQGITPLSNEMVNNGFFWGYEYFQIWVVAHIVFTFLPKKV